MNNNYETTLIDICKIILEQSNKYNITNHSLIKKHKEEIITATNTFPEKISLSKRIKAISKSDLCICQNCGKVHGDTDSAGYCNQKCYLEYKAKNSITDLKYKEKLISKSKQKYADLILNYDYIVCKECGFHGAELTTHIQTHGLSPEQYKQKHNTESVKCQKLIDSVSGKNNPGYQHGGKFSPFSDKFIHADKTDTQKIKEKAAKNRADNEGNTTNIEYWLKKTNGDKVQAKKLLKTRQTTFTLEKCIEKYGEEKGFDRWIMRQEKWLNTLSQKSPDELEQINKKKSNSMSYSNLWTNKSIFNGKFYLLDLGNDFYKFGITSKTITERYSRSKNYKIIYEMDSSINNCFQIEQLVKQRLYKDFIINKSEAIPGFGWTETIKIDNINPVKESIINLFNNNESTSQLFKETFNLKYAKNF